MKVYTVGLEPDTVNALREHKFEVVPYAALPESGPPTGIWIVTSETIPFSDLPVWRLRYPEATLVYWYVTPGVAGWLAVHARCQQLNIRFLRPGIGISSLLDCFKTWFQGTAIPSTKVIGVFGSAPGIGCTQVAATLAQAIARHGSRVILLGLNLFGPGWEKEATVSLDRWRQRLIGRLLKPEDFAQLIRTQGFLYLPGNFDPLSALDYEEEDIAHLLQMASEEADIIVADCGAIPESAAWFCGMQQAGLRILVTRPQYARSLNTLLQVVKRMEIPAEHLFLCGNRIRGEDLPLKQLAVETDTQPWFSFPEKGWTSEFTLPLGRREQEAFDEALAPLLATFGLEKPDKKKRWL